LFFISFFVVAFAHNIGCCADFSSKKFGCFIIFLLLCTEIKVVLQQRQLVTSG